MGYILEIRCVQRRLRGGSQSWLVQAEDQNWYVVKCLNNPQGTRTLVNEWIATWFLEKLKVCIPKLRLVRFSDDLNQDKRLVFNIGNRKVQIENGVHLGSLCPVNPQTTAILDILPRTLLHLVINPEDFATCLVFDIWAGQIDTRQAIYFRERGAKNRFFRGCLVDHGQILAGHRWEFTATSGQGFASERGLYSLTDVRNVCASAVTQIEEFTKADVHESASDIPTEWISNEDRKVLSGVFDTLILRRHSLRDLVSRSLERLPM